MQSEREREGVGEGERDGSHGTARDTRLEQCRAGKVLVTHQQLRSNQGHDSSVVCSSSNVPYIYPSLGQLKSLANWYSQSTLLHRGAPSYLLPFTAPLPKLLGHVRQLFHCPLLHIPCSRPFRPSFPSLPTTWCTGKHTPAAFCSRESFLEDLALLFNNVSAHAATPFHNYLTGLERSTANA
jgi:hypothetical protein